MQEIQSKMLENKVRVTKLEALKNKKYRVTIANESYDLNEDTILHFRLVKDKCVDSIEKILEYDLKIIYYNKYKNYLFKFPKSEKQFLTLLKVKEPNLSIDDTYYLVTRLKNEKILDDNLYANSIFSSLIKRGYGRSYIEKNLLNRGIGFDIINDLLDKYDIDEQFVYNLALKQNRNYQKYPIFKQKQKLTSYLLNKGYDFKTINIVLDKIYNE